MKVFLSWSQSRSEKLARALRDWLPGVIQVVEPWMSAKDIEAGSRWSKNIAEQLEASRFGIICVTPENQNAPWILFEAGVLAKSMENAYVCPYLYDLSPSDLSNGPLSQFQAKQANEYQTWELAQTINQRLENSISDELLKRAFDLWWPDLKEILLGIPELKNETVNEPNMSDSSYLESITMDILSLKRDLNYQNSNIKRILRILYKNEMASNCNEVYDLKLLNGVWMDNHKRSINCIKWTNGKLLWAYSYGGYSDLTANHYDVVISNKTIFSKFQWFKNITDRDISGYSLYVIESENYLTGGWWYDHDIIGSVKMDVEKDITNLDTSIPKMNETTLEKIDNESFPDSAKVYFECILK